MEAASSLAAAKREALRILGNLPTEQKTKIAVGAASGVIVGLLASGTGVGTVPGLTTAAACGIIVSVCLDDLNTSSNES